VRAGFLDRFLARHLYTADEGILTELSRLEDALAAVARLVWADVRHEVDSTRRTVDELRSLLGTIATSDEPADAGLTAFVASTNAFCDTLAAEAIKVVGAQHEAAEETTRALLRFLAVDEKHHARPEESLGALHEVVLSVTQSMRFHALAVERTKRMSRLEAQRAMAQQVRTVSSPRSLHPALLTSLSRALLTSLCLPTRLASLSVARLATRPCTARGHPLTAGGRRLVRRARGGARRRPRW
jgi:hypothetical protein